jgi:hypothetical protein
MLYSCFLIAFDFGPRFRLGRVCITPGAAGRIPQEEVHQALRRHARGDWGELGEEDRKANDGSLDSGCRLLSAYHASNGTQFWIITEASRATTTVLLPEEY